MPGTALKPPPAYPGMAIGLLGGSFDPPHEGHLHVSEIALRRLALDRLWWLVTPGNPLKSRDGAGAFAKRLRQARALARHPRIDVTGFEAARGSAYTADTIAFLVNRYPATRFVWVMGADSLAGFHRWRLWQEIMATLPVAVIDRPGYRHRALASRAARRFDFARVDECDAEGLSRFRPPAWLLLTNRLSPLSSTELRRKTRGKT